MTIELKVLNDKIVEVSNDNTLLDMLMEFEKTLDELNLFAFKNWRKGEILEGPQLNRHRASIKLMYMAEDMPDPDAVKRLLARDMLVKYKKDTLIRPVKVKTYDDVEVDMKPDGGTRYKAIHIPTHSSITIDFGSSSFHIVTNMSVMTIPKKNIAPVIKRNKGSLIFGFR